jgi:hypothetical protein
LAAAHLSVASLLVVTTISRRPPFSVDHHLAAAIYLAWAATGRFGTASRRTRAETKEGGESVAHDPQGPEIAASIGLVGKKLPIFGLHRRLDVASNHHAC